jgi:hypothetical protein
VPDQPPGAVRVPLRYLDQVLSSAQRARIRLDVPWDLIDEMARKFRRARHLM